MNNTIWNRSTEIRLGGATSSNRARNSVCLSNLSEAEIRGFVRNLQMFDTMELSTCVNIYFLEQGSGLGKLVVSGLKSHINSLCLRYILEMNEWDVSN